MRAKTKHSERGGTRERLLDTAERLFAHQGFDGVGMRELAARARVNLGAATYHFGSKEKLYIETFLRRFRPVAAARLEMLRQHQAAAGGRPLPVPVIVECMLRAPLMTARDHPHFPPLMARNLVMPPPCLADVLEQEFWPSLEPFLDALGQALPALPRRALMMRTMLLGGSLLMLASQLGGIRAQARAGEDFLEPALRDLVRFAAAGLQAPPPAPGEPEPVLPHNLPQPRASTVEENSRVL